MSLVDDNTQRSDALAVLRGLIDLLANPKAASELIDKLSAAQAKTDEARAAIKQLAVERERVSAAQAAELDAHRRTLQDERLALNNEINQQRNEIQKAEATLKAASAKAEEDARQAVELRARWQRKVDAIDAGLRV
jgi:chromosome segregation ATPase